LLRKGIVKQRQRSVSIKQLLRSRSDGQGLKLNGNLARGGIPGGIVLQGKIYPHRELNPREAE